VIITIFSVLSEDSDCCETLHNYAARIGLLLGPSCAGGGQWSERLLAVLSRLGYMLGNILAKHESARIQVGFLTTLSHSLKWNKLNLLFHFSTFTTMWPWSIF